MFAPPVTPKVTVGRILPDPSREGDEAKWRGGRYGEGRVESIWPTDHLLADEGSYMAATMLPGATAINMGVSAAYDSTIAHLVLANADPAGGRRLYPRFLELCVSGVGAGSTDFRYALVLDSKDRTPTTISSGTGGVGPGTPAASTAYRAPVVCTNMDVTPNRIAGVPFFPLVDAGTSAGPTVPSAGQFARVIVGNGVLHNAIPTVKSLFILQFGGNGGRQIGFWNGSSLARSTTFAPPVVVGPGQFMTLHFWGTSQSQGLSFDNFALEWVER